MKIWKISFLCALLIMILTVTVHADNAGVLAMTDSGKCGENITWELNANGVLKISGTGEIAEDENSENYLPWLRYRHYITAVSVSDGVTNIPDYAFSRCDYLESAQIGNTVERIGQEAFASCSRLTEISGWNAVKTIGDYAFANCTALTSIEFGDALKTIGAGAFARCGLASLQIPDSVEEIAQGAFEEENKLKSVAIGNGVTFLNRYVFGQCDSLKTIIIPATVTAIDESAFERCWISDVYYSGTAAQWNRIRGGGADDLAWRTWRIYFESTGPDDAIPMTYDVTVTENHSTSVEFTINANGNGIENVRVIVAFYDENGRFIYTVLRNPRFLNPDIPHDDNDNFFRFWYWGHDVSAKTAQIFVLDENFKPLCPSAVGTFDRLPDEPTG